MTLVRILRNYEAPDLLRQTPHNSGVWEGIRFVVSNESDPRGEAPDYVVVLNYVRRPVELRCRRDRIWGLSQEPPLDDYLWHRSGHRHLARCFTTDERLAGDRYALSQPALPWFVNRSLEELRTGPVPAKTRRLSWVTSNKSRFPGHQQRIAFLQQLRGRIEFDLFGHGFDAIGDKWDGLASYRYSLAMENYSGPWYWSEKLADCYLAWAMPIYFGCTNLDKFFPPESYVAVDPEDPNAVEQIREVIESDLWLRRRDAMAEARRRILEQYQLFPFLAAQVLRDQVMSNQSEVAGRIERVVIPATVRPEPLKKRLARTVRGWLGVSCKDKS